MYNASSECPVLEILHSCTPDNNKEAVLQSFGKEDGPILVLVATIAFGMRVDSKGLHREIHFGPSKNVEAFMQETGLAERDGKPSISYLLYKGLLLNHVEKDIKEYLKTKECQRKTLLKHFGSENFTASDPLPIAVIIVPVGAIATLQTAQITLCSWLTAKEPLNHQYKIKEK